MTWSLSNIVTTLRGWSPSWLVDCIFSRKKNESNNFTSLLVEAALPHISSVAIIVAEREDVSFA